MEALIPVVLVLVALIAAVALRNRRRRLAHDATLSIRDHDADRRVYGRGGDVPAPQRRCEPLRPRGRRRRLAVAGVGLLEHSRAAA